MAIPTQLPGSRYKRHGGAHPTTSDRHIQTHLLACPIDGKLYE